jgi:hypothetical protein
MINPVSEPCNGPIEGARLSLVEERGGEDLIQAPRLAQEGIGGDVPSVVVEEGSSKGIQITADRQARNDKEGCRRP